MYEKRMQMEPRLTHVDSIYIPVMNKKRAMDWFIHHFGLSVDDRDSGRLKIGPVEMFFLETLDRSTTNFHTKDWVPGEDHYVMPAFCFKAVNIGQLYNELKDSGVTVGPLLDHNWFLEFDFDDLDGNRFKVWEPKR